MGVERLTDQYLEFLSLTGGCTGSSESIHVNMPHCWKSHVAAHIILSTHCGAIMPCYELSKCPSYLPHLGRRCTCKQILTDQKYQVKMKAQADLNIDFTHVQQINIKCLANIFNNKSLTPCQSGNRTKVVGVTVWLLVLSAKSTDEI